MLPCGPLVSGALGSRGVRCRTSGKVPNRFGRRFGSSGRDELRAKSKPLQISDLTFICETPGLVTHLRPLAHHAEPNWKHNLIELGCRNWWGEQKDVPLPEQITNWEESLATQQYGREPKSIVAPASVFFAIELA
jgi:hypothetical protein